MRRPVLASLAFAFALGASSLALAQADKVVATVDGAPITEGEVAIAIDDLGDRVPQQAGPAQRRDYAISYLVDLKIAAKAAREAKVGEGP